MSREQQIFFHMFKNTKIMDMEPQVENSSLGMSLGWGGGEGHSKGKLQNLTPDPPNGNVEMRKSRINLRVEAKRPACLPALIEFFFLQN